MYCYYYYQYYHRWLALAGELQQAFGAWGSQTGVFHIHIYIYI